MGYVGGKGFISGFAAIQITLAIFMRLRLARYALLALALFLGGCKFVLPAPTSVTVEVYGTGGTLRQTKLTKGQVQALTNWFSSHQAGWSSSYASYAPTYLVRVAHSNGDVTVINILPTVVVVYNRDGQYVQQFEARELSALRNNVGLPNG